MLSFGEKIKVVLSRRNMTLGELAIKCGQSRQNLTNKITRDNFTEREMLIIAEALNCTLDSRLIMNDTKETV